jgi:hypothetical protein
MVPFSPVSSILPGQGNIEGTENVGRPGIWDFPCLCFRTSSDDQTPYDKKDGVSFLLPGWPVFAGAVIGNAWEVANMCTSWCW